MTAERHEREGIREDGKHEDKLTGADRPATLFTWPRTNRLPTMPYKKTALKSFQDLNGIEKNLTAELNAVLLDSFDDCFVGIFEGYNKIVAVERDNFE
jgi:hypothetical protein